MSLGFGFSLPAYTGYAAAFGSGAALALDFLNGNNTLDPRITFSRTTNATLTNSAGLIANAPMNLLTFSEQFDNAAWAKLTGGTGVTPVVTANAAAAPNGTTTADQVVFNRGAGTSGSDISYLAFSLTAFTATATASVWLKTTDGTTKTMSFRCGAPAAQQITVTGEWQRFTLTQTNATIDRVQILLYGNDGAQTVSVFIWGAQLEVGSTATTYNSTTVKNLLGFTENFDNAAWTKSNASISATKVDDIYGQPFAQKLVENTATAGHYIVSGNLTAVSGTPITATVYAKAGERGWLILYEIASNSGRYFNLLTGEKGSALGSAPASDSIVAIGDGWHRVSITVAVVGSAAAIRVYGTTANGVTSYAGDGTSGIYIFGAQLSDSASVDPYVYQPVAAPTSTAYYGPRFDYDPVTLAPKGLLIEEQRTQLLLNSSLSGTSLATQNVTVAAVAHTLSFYGTGTVTLSGVSTAGPLVGTGAYPNRVTLTFTPTAGTLTLTVTGTVQFAQLEAGAFATSFIPSAASQVTRAADNASMIGNNFARWYNQTEGTVLIKVDAKQLSNVKYLYTVSDTTSSNQFGIRSASNNTYDAVRTSNGATVDTSNTPTQTNDVYSAAVAYDMTQISLTFTGDSVRTVSSSAPGQLTALNLGSLRGFGSFINGSIQRFAFYSRVLAASEQQAITS